MSLYKHLEKSDWDRMGNQLKENATFFPDQRSTQDQMRDLLAIATRLRLYDAADLLKSEPILKGYV